MTVLTLSTKVETSLIEEFYYPKFGPGQLYETMASLINDPDRIKFRELLKNHTGESDEIEFKGDYIEYPKLAKHILAMANSGGGLIIFGVSEDDNHKLTPTGLDLKDKTDIQNKLSNYLPETLEYYIENYEYDNNVEWDKIKDKNFQIITILQNLNKIPFVSKKDGDSLKRNRIYCRRNSSSDEATYEDLQEILDKRISDSLNHEKTNLTIDLEQLETLTSYFSIQKKPFYMFTNPTFLAIVEELSKQKIEIIKEKMK